MKTLLIVYQSTTGGTRQMVEAAAAGAAAEAATVRTRVVPAVEAVSVDVLEADAYLFAAPENLASMAGLMKDFFDRTYYAALGRIEARPYAAMVCAGSDGSGAMRQIERIATGWRLRAVAPALIVCTHAQTPDEIARPKQLASADVDRCRELGAAIAGGLSLGIF